MSDKLKAADALAKAVRGTKERQSPDVLAALAAYEAAPAESQAEGEEHPADWQRAIASDFSRWFENEGVGSCFDECLAIVKQHAPLDQSQQLAAAQARIVSLTGELDACEQHVKIKQERIDELTKSHDEVFAGIGRLQRDELRARVSVLEKALEDWQAKAKGVTRAYEDLRHVEDQRQHGEDFDADGKLNYAAYLTLRNALESVNAALAAQPSREKEGA